MTTKPSAKEALAALIADCDAGWVTREAVDNARAALATAPAGEPPNGELEARLLIYANDIAAHGAGDEDSCRECLAILHTLWRDATNAAKSAPPAGVAALIERLHQRAKDLRDGKTFKMPCEQVVDMLDEAAETIARLSALQPAKETK